MATLLAFSGKLLALVHEEAGWHVQYQSLVRGTLVEVADSLLALPQMNSRLMPNDGDLLDLFAEWVPDQATRVRILSENPHALYR